MTHIVGWIESVGACSTGQTFYQGCLQQQLLCATEVLLGEGGNTPSLQKSKHLGDGTSGGWGACAGRVQKRRREGGRTCRAVQHM